MKTGPSTNGTDTPRTDANVGIQHQDRPEWVDADFARQLERELAEVSVARDVIWRQYEQAEVWNEALEAAAKVADGYPFGMTDCSKRIRALKRTESATTQETETGGITSRTPGPLEVTETRQNIGFNEFLGQVQKRLLDAGYNPPAWPDAPIRDLGDYEDALESCVRWCMDLLDAQRAEVDTAQAKDAARFQWLCDAAGREWDELLPHQMAGRLREVIDAAMRTDGTHGEQEPK